MDDRGPLFVELCAGSAALSSAVAKSGITVVAFNCDRNRHQPLTQVHTLDLLLDSSWQFLHELRISGRKIVWHMGLPCGTCSKAREIRLNHNDHGPGPLRDWNSLLGFPWNSATNKAKVESANMVYMKELVFSLCNFWMTIRPSLSRILHPAGFGNYPAWRLCTNNVSL